jgi:hypothetical protein
MDYEIFWESPNGFYVRFTGWVTPESAARLAHELTSDVRYDNLRYGIIDLTASPGHTFRREDRAAIASSMAETIGARFSNPHMLEVAIASEPRMLSYLSTYAAFSRRPLEVFATLDKARSWLSEQTASIRQLSARDGFYP